MCLWLPVGAQATVEQVSIAYSGGCATDPTSGVNCWGYHPRGSWIKGSIPALPATEDQLPTAMDNLEGVATDVTVSGEQACAVLDGAAFCWGENGRGQLGDGTRDSSVLPVPVVGLTSGVEDIETGPWGTCAIKSGAAFCWGGSAAGALTGSPITPTPVPGLESGVTSISLSGSRGCAVVTGQGICWGNGADIVGRDGGGSGYFPPAVSAGLLSGVQEIFVDWNSACAIVSGSARCWGVNDEGQLGDGTTESTVGAESRQVSGLTSGVTAINLSDGVACAVASGSAKCWGSNLGGLHGDGTYETESGKPSTPAQVAGLEADVDAVAVGYYAACARQSGTIKCWGRGNLGNDWQRSSSSPIAVAGGHSFSHLTATNGQLCGIESGAALCWSSDDPADAQTQGVVPRPVGAPFDQNVTAMAGSDCGIVDGSVSCQISRRPNPIPGLEAGAVAISSRDNEVCASTADVVSCWPRGASSSGPYVIEGVGAPVTSLASGVGFNCAIADGGARCWGVNYDGELGAPREAGTSGPLTPIGLSSGVTSIAAGHGFACAAKSGEAWCWGESRPHQAGDDPANTTFRPARVGGLPNGVVSVTTGDNHACALTDIGAIYCWGANELGQLGAGNYDATDVPVQVQGVGSGATEVVATASIWGSGTNSTCALVNGIAKCWGDNTGGRLGIGSITWHLTPVATAPPVEPPALVVVRSPARHHRYFVNSIPVDIFANFEGDRVCKLDEQPYGACGDSLTNLDEGFHTLRAQVTDDQGNSVTGMVSFEVNTLDPVITLTGVEDDLNAVNGEWRTLGFATSEPLGITYCQVDDDPRATCLPDTNYMKWFAPGLHTVTVEAHDGEGRSTTVTKVFRIGPIPGTEQPTVPDAPRPDDSADVKPLSVDRASATLSATFALMGSYRKGTRKLTARARVASLEGVSSGGCNGVVRIASPRLGVKPRSIALRLDAAKRCIATRTITLKRASKGKTVSFTFEFAGNGYFLPTKRSASKRL